MRKLIFLLLCLIPTVAQADIIIGFRGKGGAFDERAFVEFAAKRNLGGIILQADQIDKALEFIKENPTYELYGYSKGAASVAQVLRKVKHMPRHVWTVGAYYSTDVDFRKYNVKFDNYFDASGAGTKSPGKHIGGVSHYAIMRFVTDYYGD